MAWELFSAAGEWGIGMELRDNSSSVKIWDIDGKK